ncbi:hypothetical protein CTAYLR_005999 [Chrysophaeum taylorii]|uniref:Amino acid transporter transmembrane domain-containing protein n=1 Tax=Chrysophaeum taylorii TaxID=2483200 RepID=A0AAD7U6U5_9STRA|nr:hypothetical protein CTAYLR_005999 [Chrysophaeum taylorii]
MPLPTRVLFVLVIEELRSRAGVVAGEEKPSSVAFGTLNLIKSIVGAGVLALPAGVAAFASARLALVVASAIVVLLGWASAYSFAILGRICGAYEADSYREAWSKTMSERTAWIVTACCTITPLFACLAYAIIIGDSFAAISAASSKSPPPALASLVALLGGTRRFFISVFSVGVLWPLCSLRSLAALAPTSALGTAGVLYTAGFMGLRAIDGSYFPGGRFCAADAVAPCAAQSVGDLFNPRLGVFVAMLGTAYMAHFNAPSFFKSAGRDLDKFRKVVALGFGFSVLFNLAVMASGFWTFGPSSLGLILNNYATTDLLASVARLLFGVSIVFTYPLAFAGAKDGLRQLDAKLFGGGKGGKPNEARVVAAPLALLTALALVLNDVGLVVSLTGALMGSAVIYILPALMLLNSDPDKLSRSRFERKVAPMTMIILGAVSGVLGVVKSF